MKKLWQHGSNKTDDAIEAYLAGDDPSSDLVLLPYDIAGSKAHIAGLKKIGVLSAAEHKKLEAGLKALLALWKKGKIVIRPEDEDCHTVIEHFLTARYGSVGEKIHTGRSRNDQVLTALRLYMKEKLAHALHTTEALAHAFAKKAAAYGNAPMPGYTHMQRAMPSTAAAWLGSFADALKDDGAFLKTVLAVIDQSPLGSVAGYGDAGLGLDRKYTAAKLGFARVQKNPIYCAMSRGKFELVALQALQGVMFDIGKFATDALLFSTKEFGFLSLPVVFATGSSAMPQKRNYDALELMRAHAALFAGAVNTLVLLIGTLPSGYNRDFQLTKKVFISAVEKSMLTINAAALAVDALVLDRDAMKAAVTPEMHATEEAYALVKKDGVPFRAAYRQIARKYLPKHE